WGGLTGSSWTSVAVMALYVPVPLIVLFAAARPLDLLQLGDEPARYLGADVAVVKRRALLAGPLRTAAAVAAAGAIGFVGLIVASLGWAGAGAVRGACRRMRGDAGLQR